MLVQCILLLSILHRRLTVIAYELVCTILPSKSLLFQTVRSPLEVPIEGEKAKLSRFLGQNFLR